MMRRLARPRWICALLSAGLLSAALISSPSAVAGSSTPKAVTSLALARSHIKHVILVVMENHSFDSMFGTYPGVQSPLPRRTNGTPYGVTCGGGTLNLNRAPDQPGNVDHSFQAGMYAVDGGKMDCFDKLGGAHTSKGYPGYAYYDRRSIPAFWSYADHFVLGDNYFSAEYGPTGPNILWSFADSSGGFVGHEGGPGEYGRGKPREYCADPSERAWSFKALDTTQAQDVYNLEQGPVTPATIQQIKSNYWYQRRPCRWLNTLPSELSAKQFSWRVYRGINSFTQSLAMVRNVRNVPSMWSHMRTDNQLISDMGIGVLPRVSWLIPGWTQSQHPPESMCVGEDWLVHMVNSVMKSKFWSSTAIFVTYDEFGGFYDHVPAPHPDIYGFGPRLPLLMISPWAARGTNPNGHGAIDHTQYSLDSTLRFIEDLEGVAPLNPGRDGAANDMLGAFDFSHPALPRLVLKNRACRGVRKVAPTPQAAS
jgi:phospholipase C